MGKEMTAYSVDDSPKMLKETLCVAQTAINEFYRNADKVTAARWQEHIYRLQRLIDECDRHRPVGPDGKHNDRHTATCGCDRS